MSSTNGSGARLPLGIFALCLAVVAALWAALIFDANRAKDAAISQARSDSDNLTMAFRENVRRTMGAIDQLLLTIITANAASGDELHIPTWVKNTPLVGEIVHVAIAGPSGAIVDSTLGASKPIDISDRPHFRYHLDPSAAQPYISVPVVGRSSGKWSIEISRRIPRKDGSFGGVLVVSVDPQIFTRFFQDADLGPDGVILLIGLDGIVRARRAQATQEIGQDLGSLSLFTLLKTSSAGNEIVRSKIDGITRIYGYAMVPGYPLVVSVGLARNTVLAAANRERDWNFAIGGGLTIVILALSWILAHETRRRRQRELEAHASERVGEQKALLDTAVNNMRHGLVMFDRDRRAVVINRSYIEMYRLSPEAAIPGCSIRELLEQRRASGTFTGDTDDYIEHQIIGGGSADKIFDIPDGRSIRIVNRIKNDGGWVSIHEDVTERVRAEQERDRNREFLDHVIDAVGVSIIVRDARTFQYILVNRATEQLLGVSREDLIGKTPQQIFGSESAKSIADHDRKSLESPSYYFASAHPIVLPGNDTRLITSNRIAIRNSAGEAQYLLGVIEDVTERVRVERERDRNREFLDRIIDIVSVAIIVKDARTLQYVLVNRASEQWLGLRREDVIGKTSRQIYDSETADLIEENDRKALQPPWQYSVAAHPIATPRNGTRLIMSNRIAICNSSGEVEYLLGVVEDMTERKNIEDQLHQAQKMEAVGQLTGGIAHDFNNMLTVITGSIDILIDGVAKSPELAEIALMIGDAADRAAELTGHLLAFARKQPLQPQATDINALIVESERLLRPTLGEHIAVKTILQPGLWSALVDPGQLSTALLNLAINARDAMPEGGELTLVTGNTALDQSYADTNHDIRPGNYVFIAVSDTGTGIADEDRHRIFEPFFTTKEVGRGTGLGLSMVYGFVKQSGGDIKVESEKGRGTTFKIYLPRAEAAAQRMAAPIPDLRIKGGDETILVVEDDPLARTHVTAQLNSLGYKTLVAADATEALAIADSGAPFDLLFTDVIMPGDMNGRQLAEEIIGRRPGLKVLLTSGYTANAAIHRGRLDPGVLLLAKPYRKLDLARMLRCALECADASAADCQASLATRAV